MAAFFAEFRTRILVVLAGGALHADILKEPAGALVSTVPGSDGAGVSIISLHGVRNGVKGAQKIA